MSNVESVLEVSSVRKQFTLVELERILEFKPREVIRSIEAVHDVSFTVGKGQVYGFLGPNGAGKTTTIKMCMDLIRPTSGTIRLFGQPPGDPSAKRKVGYLPEHPYFYDYLKPQEILDLFGRIFGLDKKIRKQRIDDLLERVGLSDARNRSLRKFSKGMLQRLGVAQALINDPDLLVLDEPLSGLDPMGRKEICDLVIEERNKGKSILFISHILSDIEHLCDRVAIITQGKVVKEGPITQLLQSDQRQTEILARQLNSELVSKITSDVLRIETYGSTTRCIVDSDSAKNLISTIVNEGGVIERVQPHSDSLEDLFLREAGVS